jgi:hypothetical protein
MKKLLMYLFIFSIAYYLSFSSVSARIVTPGGHLYLVIQSEKTGKPKFVPWDYELSDGQLYQIAFLPWSKMVVTIFAIDQKDNSFNHISHYVDECGMIIIPGKNLLFKHTSKHSSLSHRQLLIVGSQHNPEKDSEQKANCKPVLENLPKKTQAIRSADWPFWAIIFKKQ